MTGLTVGAIAAALGVEAEGELSLEVDAPAEPAQAGPRDLAVAMSPKFAERLGEGQARAALLWVGADWRAMGLDAAIFAPRPRYALAGLTGTFAPPPDIAPGIHPTAIIAPSADIGAGAAIGPYTVIGERVRIGPNARIASHVSIGRDTVIGTDAVLLAGIRIAHEVVIGDRFIGHCGAVLGDDGFSFVTPQRHGAEEARETGAVSGTGAFEQVRIHSLGGLVIGNDVEVGSNAAIDRGTIAATTVGDGTKIDNMVQIGHNVKIGRHCLLCGQVGVAGSAVIGDRVVVGGQSAIADHLVIGDDAIITGKTGVASNVPPRRVMMGTPAVRMDQNVAQYKALRRLPRLAERVEALQKQVSNLMSKE